MNLGTLHRLVHDICIDEHIYKVDSHIVQQASHFDNNSVPLCFDVVPLIGLASLDIPGAQEMDTCAEERHPTTDP